MNQINNLRSHKYFFVIVVASAATPATASATTSTTFAATFAAAVATESPVTSLLMLPQHVFRVASVAARAALLHARVRPFVGVHSKTRVATEAAQRTLEEFRHRGFSFIRRRRRLLCQRRHFHRRQCVVPRNDSNVTPLLLLFILLSPHSLFFLLFLEMLVKRLVAVAVDVFVVVE